MKISSSFFSFELFYNCQPKNERREMKKELNLSVVFFYFVKNNLWNKNPYDDDDDDEK